MDPISDRLHSLSLHRQHRAGESAAADTDASADAESVSLTRWRLPLATVYQLACNWVRHSSQGTGAPLIGYETRVQLAALSQQVSLGPCRSAPRAPVGTLDLVGRARREAWLALGYRSRADCQLAYIDTVLAVDTAETFTAYLTDARNQIEQQQHQEQNQDHSHEQQEDSQDRQEQEETARQIQDALNRQTYAQFREYAERQYPGQCERQALLVRQLQQQHYRQYMQQLYQYQYQEVHSVPADQQQQVSPSADTAGSDSARVSGGGAETSSSAPFSASFSGGGSGEISGSVPNSPSVSGGGNGDISSSAPIPTSGSGSDSIGIGVDAIDGSTTEPDQTVLENSQPSPLLLQPAQLWTRDNIVEFKAAVLADQSASGAGGESGGGTSVLRVAHGETVSVQVPTLSDGARLHWEFATDSYDLGFGVMFEWRACDDDRVTIHVSESDEDDDDDDLDDDDAVVAADEGQSGYDEERAARANRSVEKPPTSCVIPIYRRDCHKLVYAGSHTYPSAEGMYVLKFDNSYSLWRSKTLYFRVFYSR